MISLQASSPEGYALRALANINRKRYTEAEADVRKAIEIAPQSSFGYVQMGNLKFAQRQFSEAAQAYQTALDQNQNSTDALRGLMNSYVAQKQLDRALAIAEAQIAKVPNDGAFYDLLGSALFYNKHDLPAAEVAFAKSAELDKKRPDSLIKLAEVEAAQGKSADAIATCQQGLQTYPHEVNFYFVLGEIYQSKRDWPNAGDSYQKALVITPESPIASGKLAYVMLQSGQNLDVALSLAQNARRGLPTSPAVADTLRLDLLPEGGLLILDRFIAGSSATGAGSQVSGRPGDPLPSRNGICEGWAGCIGAATTATRIEDQS